MTFANSLVPDQALQNIGPDIDPNLKVTVVVFLIKLFEKRFWKKKSADGKKHEK